MILTKTIIILSLVSLFTDIASEMLYPIMPIYLQSIGFSIVLIGILEGFAEAIAGLSKGYFGKLSDISGKRVPFIRLGYFLSAISKPMMAIFIYPLWIFLARTIDRFGKGIRTGARDALLSSETTAKHKGKVFGFHRALDTLGAMIGPILALIFLKIYPEKYELLFFLAFFPGLIAVSLTFLLKEKSVVQRNTKHKPSFLSFLRYWKDSQSAYRKLLIGLLAFTLLNSSDIFLLLKAKQSGLSDSLIISLYIFYNLTYALSSYPAGILGDKIGLKPVYLGGLGLFSLVYFGFGLTNSTKMFFLLFALYGIYSAMTEGISKAWITNIAESKDTATAIGTYMAFNSLFSLIASSLAGLIWYQFGSEYMFLMSSIGTIAVMVWILLMNKFKHSHK